MVDGYGIGSRLRAGERVHGVSIGVAHPALIQMCGYAGYDFVVLDNEHGPASVETTGEAIRAARGVGVVPIVRTFEPEISRLLDAGAGGIQVPMVETPEQAERIVRACRYPPAGGRSVAFSTPAAHYGFADRKAHIESSNRAIAVVLMIETAAAMERLGEILAVPGVDAVCIGPTDMSYSLGVPGDGGHPKVAAAVAECARACRQAGIAVGANAFSPAEYGEHVAMGMTYHTVMMTMLLGKSLREQLVSMRGAASDA